MIHHIMWFDTMTGVVVVKKQTDKNNNSPDTDKFREGNVS